MKELFSKKKLTNTRLFAFIFMIGFVIGIIMANTVSKDYISETGILSDYFISRYKYMEFSFMGLFWFVLKKRVKWLVLLWGMGLTILGVPLVWGYSAWLGIAAGMLLSVSVLRFGFLGIMISLLALLPQMLIYAPAYVVFMNHVYRVSVSQYAAGQGKIPGITGRKKAFLQYMLVLVLVLAAFTVGAFLESHINPVLLKAVLKNI